MDPHEPTESAAWVFDSLVGFLHGPIWNVPLQTFIEEKSLPFEPTEGGEVCDKPEYKVIHDEYRNLVDVMLGSFMEDIGISAEQFEEACRMSRRQLEGLPMHFHRRLFEQIWAANDYAIFTKMMTHKNVDLQLQALELIERRFGALPDVFLPLPAAPHDREGSPRAREGYRHSESDESGGEWADRDDIMNEIKKLTLADSGSDSEDVVKAPEPTRLDIVAEKKHLKSKLHSFETRASQVSPPLAPGGGRGDAGASVETPGVVKESPKHQQASEEEVKQRQEYLKRQRDKLLALKRQIRERQLGSPGAEAARGERPRSARVARSVLAGRAPPPAAPERDSTLLLRRALVDRLKAEVVDGNH